MHVHRITRYQPGVDHGGRIVLRVLATPGRVLEYRCPQGVIRVGIGQTDTLVDHVIE